MIRAAKLDVLLTIDESFESRRRDWLLQGPLHCTAAIPPPQIEIACILDISSLMPHGTLDVFILPVLYTTTNSNPLPMWSSRIYRPYIKKNKHQIEVYLSIPYLHHPMYIILINKILLLIKCYHVIHPKKIKYIIH